MYNDIKLDTIGGVTTLIAVVIIQLVTGSVFIKALIIVTSMFLGICWLKHWLNINSHYPPMYKMIYVLYVVTTFTTVSSISVMEMGFIPIER